MFEIKLEYKSFKVGLDKFASWCKQESDLYVGMVASDSLTLVFSSQPSDVVVSSVKEKWNNLVDGEFTYVSHETRQNTINSLKKDMVTKSYDQLTQAQKKILLGLDVTNEEIGL